MRHHADTVEAVVEQYSIVSILAFFFLIALRFDDDRNVGRDRDYACSPCKFRCWETCIEFTTKLGLFSKLLAFITVVKSAQADNEMRAGALHWNKIKEVYVHSGLNLTPFILALASNCATYNTARRNYYNHSCQ
jgi:hypothetical protein